MRASTGATQTLCTMQSSVWSGVRGSRRAVSIRALESAEIRATPGANLELQISRYLVVTSARARAVIWRKIQPWSSVSNRYRQTCLDVDMLSVFPVADCPFKKQTSATPSATDLCLVVTTAKSPAANVQLKTKTVT